MMTKSRGATNITNKRVNERQSAEDSLVKINAPGMNCINSNYPQQQAGDTMMTINYPGNAITDKRWKDPLGIKLLAYGNYPQKICWGYKCLSEQLIRAKETQHQELDGDNHKFRVYIYRIRGRKPTTPRGDRTNHKSAWETKIGFIANHQLLRSKKNKDLRLPTTG